MLLDDLTHSICSSKQLPQVSLPGEIADVLMGARLTALAKPDGDVRGIATVFSMRRLVARTLAKQFAQEFEKECATCSYALSTQGWDGLCRTHAEGSHRQRPFRHNFQRGWDRRLRPRVARRHVAEGWDRCRWHVHCCLLCVSRMQHLHATVGGMTMGRGTS